MTGKCKSFLVGSFLVLGVRACLFYTADDFVDVVYLVLGKVGLNAPEDIPGCIGVNKVGGSHGYCSRSGHEELKGIFGGGDASHTDDGDFYLLGTFIDHTDGYRLDGRAGHAAGFVGKDESAAVDVYFHACQGVNQGNGIGPGRFCGYGHFCDIRDVGTEFHDDWLFCFSFNGGSDFRETIGFLAESDGSFFYVGAGYVAVSYTHLDVYKRQAWNIW